MIRDKYSRSVSISHGEGTNAYIVKEYVFNQGRFYQG